MYHLHATPVGHKTIIGGYSLFYILFVCSNLFLLAIITPPTIRFNISFIYSLL